MQKQKWRVDLMSIFGIVAAHGIACVAVWYGLLHGFSFSAWILFFLFVHLSGLGITAGYHRMLTHGSFACGGVLKRVLLACGAMACQGSARTWTTNHRVHHYCADQEEDPHSPLRYPGIRGLLWAHMGWLFFERELPPAYRIFPDLERDPAVRWQQRYCALFALLGFAAPFALAGWDGLLLAGFLRLVFVWHVTWSVNSICHVWGSQAKDSYGRRYQRDYSKNNFLVAFFGFGEGNHANHHVRPAWAYHGWKWYEFDLTRHVLWLLEAAKWIWDVKKPTRIIRFQDV